MRAVSHNCREADLPYPPSSGWVRVLDPFAAIYPRMSEQADELDHSVNWSHGLANLVPTSCRQSWIAWAVQVSQPHLHDAEIGSPRRPDLVR